NTVTVIDFDEQNNNPQDLKYYNNLELVEVTDGVLRLSVNPNGVNVKINYIQIVQVNPIATSWTDIDENENYTARHENSLVQAGDKFYLMGGRESAQTIDVYDYSTDSWNALVNSAPLQFNHFQATEYKGLIWVIGGFESNPGPNELPQEHIWAFDPVKEEWIQGPEVPVARRRGSSGLVVYNDKFYITGGNNMGHSGGFVNWFDEYDPKTGIWTSLGQIPRARDHFHAALIGDKMYLAGGRLSGGVGGTFSPTISEVDVYDFTSSTWSQVADIPTPRAGASVANFNDKLLVIGGEVLNQQIEGQNFTGALDFTEQFDPTTGTWSRLADLNSARHGTQAIVSGGGVYILAGSPNLGGGNQKNLEVFGTDTATGIPGISTVLASVDAVEIEVGGTSDIVLDFIGGNVGVIIRSIELTGSNEISVSAGDIQNILFESGDSHLITLSLSSLGTNESVVLTINYGESSTKDITISAVTSATYELIVNNGSGDGFYGSGEVANISADAAPSGEEFAEWIGAVGSISDVTNPITTVTMGTSALSVTATYSTIQVGNDLPWIEDFADLANGTIVDNGDTSWSSNLINGQLQAANGVFRVNDEIYRADAITITGVWSSEVIDLNGSTATISIDFDDLDDNKEATDFIKASYILDGGAPISFGELQGNISPQTFSVSNISGNSLQIIVESSLSYFNETYVFDNVNVTEEAAGQSTFLLKADNVDSIEVEAEETIDQIRIFPNPANLYIVVEGIEIDETVQIWNLNGQLIKNVKDRSKEIYVGDLSPATYIIKTNTGKKSRFIKQ
ncbi:MAG: kelch repeat-containing protein, partial [Maribacter sp.]